MLSELGKETVAGETSELPCYQFFKFVVITAVSHYFHKSAALFIRLVLRMVSHMQSVAGPVSIGRFSAMDEAVCSMVPHGCILQDTSCGLLPQEMSL